MNDEFGNDGDINDQAWELLRENDPANSVDAPDLASIRASVLAESNKVVRIPKRSWLAPVAVAASVALFVGGGAGYTIAAQSRSDSPKSITNFAPEMGVPSNSQAGGASGSTIGAPSGTQDQKSSLSGTWAGRGGRPFLEAGSNISDTAGVQVGYTFDASDVDRKAQLELIASTFGIKGKITGSKKDGYSVGDQNYVKPSAQISGESWDLSRSITWGYSDSSVSPTYCDSGTPVSDTMSGSSAGVSSVDVATVDPGATSEPMPDPAPSKCEKPGGTLPSDESAVALAKEKFGALSLESDSAIWTVADQGGAWGYRAENAGAYKLVTATVLVGGISSNLSWSITIGPDNAILNASGFFAKFVPTAAYNTVGAKTAIKRSQNPLWTNLQPQEVYKEGQILPMEDLALGGNLNSVARNRLGQPILDANIDRINISKAETSLITWYLNDGSTILLPAYLLSADSSAESRQWLQLAIADQYVDFS